MGLKVKQHLDLGNNAKIINLGAPTEDNDAARKIDVEKAIEGTSWKEAAAYATTSNIDLFSAPASIDTSASGLPEDTPLSADYGGTRILVKDQDTASQNGIYLWLGEGQTMLRAADADSVDDLEQAVITVEMGSSSGSSFRQSTVNFVLGGNADTDAVVWSTFGAASPIASESTAGRVEIATQDEVDAGIDTVRVITPATLAMSSASVKKYSVQFGDTSLLSYDISVPLEKQSDDFMCVVTDTATKEEVLTEILHTSKSLITVKVATAPGNNALTFTLIG